MKRIKTIDLKDGDVLAKDIYNFYNQKTASNSINFGTDFVALKGNKINERRKEFLIKYGVKEVYIKDELCNIQADDILSFDIRKKVARALEHKNIDDIISCAIDIVEEINSKDSILLDSMPNIRNDNNKIYEKGVNVCITSLAVAKNMGINDRSRLNNIAVISLLHNLGECFLEENMDIQKYFDKTPDVYKFIKDISSFFMAEYLKDNPNINLKMLWSIAFYKENVDGSGLLKHSDENIPIEAKILRVCTDYDTLVNDNDKTPIEALGEMQEHSDTFYSHKILNILTRTVAFYKLGEEVTLSTGEVGIVCKNNLGYPDRPVVMLKNRSIINLLNHNDINILNYNNSKVNDVHKK